MNQIDLFELSQSDEKERVLKEAFQKWMGLGKRTICPEGSLERTLVWTDLRRWLGLIYKGALHECHALPADKYIWLNDIEVPEYWVLNDQGNPCGEHIEICPYCGADLKNGEGNAVLLKADSFVWKLNGMLRRMT